MVGCHSKHPHLFSRLPPSNNFSRSLLRLFTNQFPIFPTSFPTFRRPFQRIRGPWVLDHLVLMMGLVETRHQKNTWCRQTTDSDVCYKKNTLQISESKTRRTNMESKQNNYRMQKKPTWNRGKKKYRMQKTEYRKLQEIKPR